MDKEPVKLEVVDCKNNVVAILSSTDLGCIDGYRIRATYEDESVAEGKNYNDFIKEDIINKEVCNV